MLRHIHLRNFRAFRDQIFKFGKINIFVGPNNSGKSSAISAINLISQTVNGSFEGRDSPLILNGQFEQLGTFIDTVHGNRSNTPMGFDFSFFDYDINIDFKLRSQRREIELAKFDLSYKRENVVKYINRSKGYDIKFRNKSYTDFFPENIKRKPTFNGFWPIFRETSRARLLRGDSDNYKLSDLHRELLTSVDRKLRVGYHDLTTVFRNFDSLGPFRDQPSRTYLYSGETASHVGQTGSHAVNLLISDAARRGAQKAGFSDAMSRWLLATGIGKGIVVKNLTPRHCEICIIGNDGVEHNICDVGFGCSQVLPVIVGAMNLFSSSNRAPRSRNPIYVVQEPEIHLHPNAQAALGSFFVGIAKERGQLFIETHSDNLVLRIARHIALGDIEEGDVRIFYIRDEGGQKLVSDIVPAGDGAFAKEWPGGFFPQRQSESLALARAAYVTSERKSVQLEFKYPEEY